MLLLYVKALHIIFVVTWFAGLFYMPRLLIYAAENAERKDLSIPALSEQYKLMQRRLWYGITWPSAILTLIFGLLMLHLYGSLPSWLIVKLCFVVGLYGYHLYTHKIFKEQQRDVYSLNSFRLRIWNEVATIFLFAIVFLVVVKNALVWTYALGGLFLFIVILMMAIQVYKKIRNSKS